MVVVLHGTNGIVAPGLTSEDSTGTSTLTTSSTATIGGALTASSTANITGTLTVGDSASITGALSATGDITFSATTAAKLPAGTTAQRPGSATNGMIRYNSDDGSFEGYAGGEWGAIGGGGDTQTATTSSTTQTAIATYAKADYGAVKAIITAWDSARPSRMVTELLITHDDSATAVATQYATVSTNDSDIVTYDVDISGANVRILATATDSAARSYVTLGSLVQV